MTTPTPTPSPAQWWALLERSGLLDVPTLEKARAAHAARSGAATADAKAIAGWLVHRGLLTVWQAKRLLAGRAGPFAVGDYVLLERRPADGDAALFTARHKPSGTVVGLVLLNGQRCGDPAVWTEIVHRTTAAAAATDPALSRTWALEQAAGNRFILCETVAGETLAAEVARCGPLPPADAGRAMHEVARAVAVLHAAGIVHGGLSLDTVIREQPAAGGPERSGRLRVLQFPLVGDPHLVPLRAPVGTVEELARLGQRAAFVAPELMQPGAVCDQRSDVYSLGCMLHSLLAGELPCWTGDPRSTLVQAATTGPRPLGPPQVPAEAGALVGYLAARDPAGRYATAAEAAAAIAACFGLDVGPPVAAVAAAAAETAAAPAMATAAPVVTTAAAQPRPVGAAVTGTIKRPPRRSAWLGTAGLVLAAVALLGGGVGTWMILDGGKPVVPRPRPVDDAPKPPPPAPPPDVAEAPVNPPADKPAPMPDKTAPAVDEPERPAPVAVAAKPAKPDTPRFVLVPDDPSLPWASPTAGPAPRLEYLPPGTEWLALVRLADLAANDEGARFVKALGPAAEAAVVEVGKLCGHEPADIELVQAGWQAPAPGELQFGLAIRLAGDKTIPGDDGFRDRAWGGAAAGEVAGETVYTAQGRSFWIPRRDKGRVLVVAPEAFMEPIIQEARDAGADGPAVALDRDLETLVGALDIQRHVTLAVLPHHLFTNGRDAFSGALGRLLDLLKDFLGDKMKAVSASLHFGDDLYAEFDAVTSFDSPSAATATILAEKLGRLPDAAEEYCTSLDADPYGRRLIIRLPAMLRPLAANLRSGVEGNVIVLNACLPPQAGHNITLAGELALAQTPGGGGAAVAVAAPAAAAAPTGALGKLDQKMTLTFLKDTLEVSIQRISDEIGVPMEIVGPDLQLEGITKNQSFALDERDKSAAEILKSILKKANPDGKLVYVVEKQDGAEAILITTRQAVEKKGYKLPPGL